ncbi:hypothetical protein K469DRAFT_74826 [Zopfia rhizophila CBS 207.26]|uniref:Uncharacterized protein n=1 Tax=Zopfia rhizophila CBS 207.26 TaxID=1314779 RepID=A0A6A6EFW6_9PEZI|nr:hypothetical protein K469DRAFT_74826 [Zopfia rhizophila CBS 207.26]
MPFHIWATTRRQLISSVQYVVKAFLLIQSSMIISTFNTLSRIRFIHSDVRFSDCTSNSRLILSSTTFDANGETYFIIFTNVLQQAKSQFRASEFAIKAFNKHHALELSTSMNSMTSNNCSIAVKLWLSKVSRD